jgi:hypothetical protein
MAWDFSELGIDLARYFVPTRSTGSSLFVERRVERLKVKVAVNTHVVWHHGRPCRLTTIGRQNFALKCDDLESHPLHEPRTNRIVIFRFRRPSARSRHLLATSAHRNIRELSAMPFLAIHHRNSSSRNTTPCRLSAVPLHPFPILSARNALRRTLPASSRNGSITNSTVRGSLYFTNRSARCASNSSLVIDPAGASTIA